jgi:cell shape-determining protein MreC
MRVRLSRKPKYVRRVQLAVAALVVVLIAWVFPYGLSFVASVVLYPVHAANVWFHESSAVIPSVFRDRAVMVARVEQLETELAASQGQQLTQQRLLEENRRLRSLLGVDETSRVAASVVSRPDELPYDLLQIDRGSNHGIAVGAPVFLGEDIMIGLVTHVAAEYAFVELVTSPGFKATAFIYEANVVADLEGLGGGVARVRVPQGIELSEGQLVVLPSVEPGMFGNIAYIENEPTQPEQFGYITPALAVSSIHLVSVGQLSQISKSPTEIESAVRERVRQSLVVPDLVISVSATTATTSLPEEETGDEI